MLLILLNQLNNLPEERKKKNEEKWRRISIWSRM